MDIAAFVLSLLAFVMSAGCLVLLLAKRFSTHRVEYINPDKTMIEYENLPEAAAAEPGAPAAPPKQWTLEEHDRQARLAELEQHLGLGYPDF